ncbi:hypothetical protein ABDK56_11120, partial [Sphingomonas sp. ASV193]|uniref:hypothetical protein n=1 Tax=Sphingomonas sp. ASV193 TaxID=3144405 RepID=UPI0032E8552A
LGRKQTFAFDRTFLYEAAVTGHGRGFAMATVARGITYPDRELDVLLGTPRAHSLDRWIFVITAAWFIVIVLAGFLPDSVRIIGAVQSGQRPPFPLIMHVHAVLTGSFLLLLLAQATLMAMGRSALHMRLGLLAFLLVPALVVVGLNLASVMYHQIWDALQAAPPGPEHNRLEAALARSDNAKLIQIRTGILFPFLMALAVFARTRDAGFHKRMVFLATAVSFPAAVNRMTWLPSELPASFIASDFYLLAAIAPLFVWDVYRNHYVHRAYWLWLALFVPASLAVNLLWDTPWWHGVARAMMGV